MTPDENNLSAANSVSRLVLEAVEKCRVTPADFLWLAKVIEDSQIVPADDPQGFLWDHLYRPTQCWTRLRNRDAVAVEFLDGLGEPDEVRARRGYLPGTRVSQPARNCFIEKCRAAGIDFTAGFVNHDDPDKMLLAWGLFAQHAIDPQQILRVEDLRRWVSRSQALEKGQRLERDECKALAGDIRSPLFWLRVHFVALKQAVIPVIDGADDAEAADFASSMLSAIYNSRDLGPLSDNPQSILEFLDALTAALGRRVGPDSRQALPAVRRVWLLCAGESVQRSTPGTKLSPPHPALVPAAQLELARIRALLVQEGDAKEQFRREDDLFHLCVFILFEYCKLWDAIRPLLLALRAVTVPTVASDLRYWPEMIEPDDLDWSKPRQWLPHPPELSNVIPGGIATNFHDQVRFEQENDPTLLQLRTAFSRFCLDRLKSKEPGGPPVELDEQWRLGYIQAARKLCINPEGKGHHILHYAGEHDPSPLVRKAAREAYAELRHGPTLGNTSPRAAFFHAFWELRRAHLLSLGYPVDEDLAKSTRDREVRRTTEGQNRKGG